MSHRYEFYFADLDTLVRVESSPDDVTIRATRDTFSERRKLSFIHELAAEGFIPEDCAWVPAAGSGFAPGVCWRIDVTWLKDSLPDQACARRFMLRLLGGATLLWLLLLAGVAWRATGSGSHSTHPPANFPVISVHHARPAS